MVAWCAGVSGGVDSGYGVLVTIQQGAIGFACCSEGLDLGKVCVLCYEEEKVTG